MPVTNYSGTTYVSYGTSSGNCSNTNSRGGTPEHYGGAINTTTDIIRVPAHENATGKVEKINRVSRTGQTVTVINHGLRTTGK